MIDYLEENLPSLTQGNPSLLYQPFRSVHPATPIQKFTSYLIEMWADEYLKLPAMHYRWSFLNVNSKFLLHEWGKIMAPHLPAQERDELVLSQKKGVSYSAMKGTLPYLGITSQTVPEIEKSFLQLLDQLESHFRIHPFLLGDRPCLGDFALMGPFYAHLYRDPYPSGIVKSHAPSLCDWIDRMNGIKPSYVRLFQSSEKGKVDQHPLGPARLGEVVAFGDFAPDDHIPETLLPIIASIFHNHIPIILSTANLLRSHFAEDATPVNGELPRLLCFHEYQIGNVRDQKGAYPYDVWMAQRVVECGNAKHPKVTEFIRQFENGEEFLLWDWESTRVAINAKNKMCRATSPSSARSKL
jgi:hypothetical protein